MEKVTAQENLKQVTNPYLPSWEYVPDGEPYVFNVCRNGDLYTQVTVVGSSSVSLYELPVGKYTIEEDTGWSWRYDAAYDPDKPDGCTLTAGHNSGSITCTNTLKNDRWLNGFSDVIANIFGIRH